MRGGSSISRAAGHPLEDAGASPAPRSILRTCRGCGCDDDHACITVEGPCAWALLDIETPTGVCTVCAEELGWHPVHMVMVGREDEPELIAAAGGGGFR